MKKLSVKPLYLCCLFALLLAGCKTTKRVGTVVAGEAKEKKVFFDSVEKQSLPFQTLSARLNVDLQLPGKDFSSRVDLKMIKDSAFQLSVQPFLGFEVLRIELSKDSVKLIDRLNKRYVAENYEKLRTASPIVFNFYNLQALFTNHLFVPGEQAVLPHHYERFELLQGGSVVDAKIKDAMNLLYTFQIDGEEKLLSTRITDPSEQYKVTWNYSDFQIVDKHAFPSLMQVQVYDKEELKGGMKIYYSRIKTDEKLNFDFSMPARYTRVTLQDILKSLTNNQQ